MISLINPKNIAMLHRTIPAAAFPFGSPGVDWIKATILMISPIAAKGILIQFRDPKHGMNPINIPIIAKIPKTKLAVFISK